MHSKHLADSDSSELERQNSKASSGCWRRAKPSLDLQPFEVGTEARGFVVTLREDFGFVKCALRLASASSLRSRALAVWLSCVKLQVKPFKHDVGPACHTMALADTQGLTDAPSSRAICPIKHYTAGLKWAQMTLCAHSHASRCQVLSLLLSWA